VRDPAARKQEGWQLRSCFLGGRVAVVWAGECFAVGCSS
jgi:hypothetical protein